MKCIPINHPIYRGVISVIEYERVIRNKKPYKINHITVNSYLLFNKYIIHKLKVKSSLSDWWFSVNWIG